MDAVTYPDPRTVGVVSDHLIAVRANISSEQALAGEFRIEYTPTVIVLNQDRREEHRSVGFLPPEEFVPFLLLGVGKAHLSGFRYRKAVQAANRILTEFSGSRWARDAEGVKNAGILRSRR